MNTEEAFMTGVNAVVIGVKDMAIAKKFYVSLGFEVEKEYPGFVGFKPAEGAVTLGLYPHEGLEKMVGLPLVNGWSGVVLNLNPAGRSRVDELVHAAASARGKVVNPPHDAEWGGRVGHFSDPDGYIWQVAAY
jgi:catechol 2,3-dioxygenase-like lactoylglutathione lyase family enzyme